MPLNRRRVLRAMGASPWDFSNQDLYDLCRAHPAHDDVSVVIAKMPRWVCRSRRRCRRFRRRPRPRRGNEAGVFAGGGSKDPPLLLHGCDSLDKFGLRPDAAMASDVGGDGQLQRLDRLLEVDGVRTGWGTDAGNPDVALKDALARSARTRAPSGPRAGYR